MEVYKQKYDSQRLKLKSFDAFMQAKQEIIEADETSMPYWIPTLEEYERLQYLCFDIINCYFWHFGYPIYVLSTLDDEGEFFSAKVCECFLEPCC